MVRSASDRMGNRPIAAVPALLLLLLLSIAPAFAQDSVPAVPEEIEAVPADTLAPEEVEEESALDTVIQFRTRGDRVRVSIDNTEPDMVRIGRSLEVPEDLTVRGDAVVIGGNLDVYGHVIGDAVVVGGVLTLHPTARIDGDAVVTAGSLEKMSGARVRGQQVNVGYGLEKLFPWGFTHPSISPVERTGRTLAKAVIWFILFFLLTLIFVDLFSGATERVTDRVREDYFRSGLAGVLGMVLTPISFLVLVISIIGLLLVPVLVVVLMVAAVWGWVAVSLTVGGSLGRKIFPGVSHPRWLTLIGFLLLGAVNLAGKLIVGLGGPLVPLGWSVLIAGKVILALAFLIGFGAVLMSRFGRRGPAVALPDEGTIDPEPEPVALPEEPVDRMDPE